MFTVLLSGDVDERMVSVLEDAYREEREEYIIYLQSEGGSVWLSDYIIDMINIHKEKTTLVILGFLASSAVNIFLESECKKVIKDSAYLMIHKMYIKAYITGVKNNDEDGNVISQELEKQNKQMLNKYISSFKLNELEINKFKRGEDIYISSKRMKKLFKNEDGYNRN